MLPILESLHLYSLVAGGYYCYFKVAHPVSNVVQWALGKKSTVAHTEQKLQVTQGPAMEFKFHQPSRYYSMFKADISISEVVHWVQVKKIKKIARVPGRFLQMLQNVQWFSQTSSQSNLHVVLQQHFTLSHYDVLFCVYIDRNSCIAIHNLDSHSTMAT